MDTNASQEPLGQSPLDHIVGQLFTPSWLSGLLAIIAGLLVSVGVVVTFQFNNGSFQQQLSSWEQTQQVEPTLTQPGEVLPPVSNNSLQGNWPLLILFGFVGLAIYYVATNIVNAIKRLAELRRELEYVNARPRAMLKELGGRLAVQIATLVVWLLFSEYFIKRIIPYSITVAHAAASDVWSFDGALYMLLSFVFIALSVQLHAVLLRILVGRPRALSSF